MMKDTVGVGISLPKKIMAQIDSERGDVSRSRYLLRLIETSERAVSKGRGEPRNVIKKDPLDEGFGTPVSRESAGA